MRATGCPYRLQFAGLESILNLLVQIIAVGHDHDARTCYLTIQRKRLAQHYHGQGLTRSLRVPDHAALALAFEIILLDPRDSLEDAEVLLMAGDLACASIKNGETAHHIQQALRAAQSKDRPILGRYGALAFCNHRFEEWPRGCEVPAENRIHFRCGQRTI